MSITHSRVVVALVSVFAVACSSTPNTDSATAQTSNQLTVTAAGSIPAGLPAHMEVGLFENSGATWMKSSGVPWDVRYAYFTYGWADNWGYGNHDGSYGLQYMNESSGEGYVPAVQYYCVNGEPGGGEAQFLSKTQNATTMAEYFGDFKLLMQNAKQFGKPVLVMMEADGFGYLEQQSGGNSSAYAAVADSGLPELAGLPNTVAGWGLAFLQLRKAEGASNVILGIHVSAWASGEDISYVSVTDPLQPQVDAAYAFLAPFGLTSNVTGSTYDVLVGDPNDRDSDYYQLVEGLDCWWDASDTASVDSESFNRYAAWLALWNAKAQRRWVLWQIPLGNSNMLDVCNDGQPRQGYKDNRPEYFFGTESAQHLSNWAQDGVVALLFGAGADCQSSYENDTYTDGQLFMESRVGAFYKSGGLPLSGSGAGGGQGSSDAGTTPPVDAGGSGGGTPAFTTSASASPATVASGKATSIVATVKDTGAALANGVVDIEVDDAAGTQVGQGTFTGVALAAGQSGSYTYKWTPSAAGTYTVKVGVFGPSWSPLYAWNDSAATVTVTSVDSAEYSFESGAQGWVATSGTTVATSTQEVYAGGQSLVLDVSESGAGTTGAGVETSSVPAGATVTFHVYVPAGSAIRTVQAVVVEGPSQNYALISDTQPIASLTAGAWNTLTVSVPSNAPTPLYGLGLEVTTGSAWSGQVYVDSVSW